MVEIQQRHAQHITVYCVQIHITLVFVDGEF